MLVMVIINETPLYFWEMSQYAAVKHEIVSYVYKTWDMFCSYVPQ